MQRVVVLGRGAAGKSTFARRLGEITNLSVIELDKLFWQPGLVPTPRETWAALQERLAGQEQWIMDGDLGPHDAVETRLRRADTIILLDFSLVRCAWQALKRSRERADFWRWLVAYRRKFLPRLLQAIARYAGTAAVLRFRDPRAAEHFLDTMRASEATTRGR
jgi:adenylate kinase family enzyme